MSTTKQRDIWKVDLEPVRGSEMGKRRPVVILNRRLAGNLSVRVVVPLTGWQDHFEGKPWLVRIEPDSENGLTKDSAANTSQIRALSTERFEEKVGELAESDFEKILAAIEELF